MEKLSKKTQKKKKTLNVQTGVLGNINVQWDEV